MGTIKDRNSQNLTKAEDIKKRWQEYTEELYKKDLHDPDNRDGVITHLEPDILECEVKRALGSVNMNKASGDDSKIMKPRVVVGIVWNRQSAETPWWKSHHFRRQVFSLLF